MKTIWIAAFVAVLGMGASGCGDDPVDTFSPTCSPGGTYIMQFATRSNSCPDGLLDTSAITGIREEIEVESSVCGSDSIVFPIDSTEDCDFSGLLTIDSTTTGPDNGELTVSGVCGENTCAAIFGVDFSKQK